MLVWMDAGRYTDTPDPDGTARDLSESSIIGLTSTFALIGLIGLIGTANVPAWQQLLFAPSAWISGTVRGMEY
jgi:hypothetical protein